MDPVSDPNLPVAPPYGLPEEICRFDGLLDSTRIPCEDLSSILEAVPSPSPLDSLNEEDEGVILGPWEVSVAHKPCSARYLDRLLSNGVVMVFEEAEDEVLTTLVQEYPPFRSRGWSSHLLSRPQIYEIYGEERQVCWDKFLDWWPLHLSSSEAYKVGIDFSNMMRVSISLKYADGT